MGKTSAKVCKQQIATELRRWVTKSKQIRINSHISYGKIKANLSALALMTSKEDLRAMTREIEIALEKIGTNNTSCLSELHIDLENIDEEKVPKTPRKRKRNNKKPLDIKRAKRALDFIDDEAEEVSGE